ncbi:hypothetical protein E2562_039323 [Oryza meyeriana var. granulata]|uniref:Uncharacterized protein n=1 Tax=Oryza meyeriana var. granulata TaxID=110450 RepID=A0A6G1E8V5_9ORYZ|nr:hypothetical protein E2562_039323 [Oryza meyeriana var. granulata]
MEGRWRQRRQHFLWQGRGEVLGKGRRSVRGICKGSGGVAVIRVLRMGGDREIDICRGVDRCWSLEVRGL